MGDKISEDAVFQVAAQLYQKYLPPPQSPFTELDTDKKRMDYANILAKDFANFHKSFYNQLMEGLVPDK